MADRKRKETTLISDAILRALRENPQGLTAEQVAGIVQISWATAVDVLTNLQSLLRVGQLGIGPGGAKVWAAVSSGGWLDDNTGVVHL